MNGENGDFVDRIVCYHAAEFIDFPYRRGTENSQSLDAVSLDAQDFQTLSNFDVHHESSSERVINGERSVLQITDGWIPLVPTSGRRKGCLACGSLDKADHGSGWDMDWVHTLTTRVKGHLFQKKCTFCKKVEPLEGLKAWDSYE